MANGIQVLPSLDRFAGLRQGSQNLVGNFLQGRQQQNQLAIQNQQQQALQQLGGQFGLNLPQGINPQLANLLIGQAFQQQGSPAGVLASPGQQLLDPQTGQPIGAGVPQKPIPQAGPLQIASDSDQSGLPTGTAFQVLPSGEVKIVSQPGGEGLTGKDRVNIARDEAKAFRADERVKNLNIIERSERGMQAALRQSKTAKSRIASDQALGVLFQKMLDPTSVVRESEFARTPQGAALINRVLGGAEQIVKGGLKMTDEDRDALVDMARKLLDESKLTANKAFSEFETRADEINLNKKIVFGGFKPFEIKTPETGQLSNLTSDLQQGASRFGLPSQPAGVNQQFRSAQQEARLQELLQKAGQ